ncbi:hypothetical protein Aduo_015372 [Ancylostoma duodenale]
MITEEELPPYDRVLLSKKPTAEGKDIRLRSDDFYKENFINIVTNARSKMFKTNEYDCSIDAMQNSDPLPPYVICH